MEALENLITASGRAVNSVLLNGLWQKRELKLWRIGVTAVGARA
ncbi:hypothetical protein [Pseudomonas syringae group genomosp. 3]|nr:hypothetical protein [Pseudomonas syringae group genomosp. 3]